MALKILDSSGLKHLLSKIKSLLSGKADKSTTLSGYGITNAYTKTETDTAINNAKYTLPNATSSVLGGVKVGTNISVSSGTISVANGSTSAKGVVQLTNSTSSTSTTTAATPNSVKSAYDLANSKQSPATTLSGYGITDAYTKTEVDTAVNGAKYTLPNATSSTLGGVKVGTNISVSSGTISVPDASIDTAGVVMLYNGVNGSSETRAATAKSVKVTYDLANGKQSPATSLSGYGITDAYTKTEVDTAINNSKYTLPNATSSTLGGVKVGSNITVSSGTISLSKTNVTNALGYTPPTTNTTYSNATTSTAGLMSTTDKAKLDGIASGANAYTLPTASSSTLGGVKTTSSVTSTSGLTACPIISGVPYYKDTNNTYTLSSFGVTATSAELNVMDGITATTTELNYCDGVTSNIQTQLNALAQRITTLESNSVGKLATVATTGSYKDLIDLPTKLNEIKDY